MTLVPAQRLRDGRDSGEDRGTGGGWLGVPPDGPLWGLPKGFIVSRRPSGGAGTGRIFVRRLAVDRGAAANRDYGGRGVARRRDGLRGDSVAYSRRFQYTNALIPA
ncbi:hypothetical protein [Paraburkholderia phenazinium]|uniref:hypothetical protein n=1 Tax=Paraburkholderia phenazinium TaxID=60549 RepID=UPI00115FEF7D|nr:hypothetical protein [Paraburkholderia phenazinium]